ncbi:hypothetical protein SAMN04487969_102437 [Paenibacillus algorifonticola]|uniref:Uncharacterized protein n=1 Tax=Paenibacillus algorifonticola TaxID=684063 RepID=A0A1I2ADN3_9BACL|nr:hypothetical protein SAMN04487969_102437 [Paenibacillus algorifonticola]
MGNEIIINGNKYDGFKNDTGEIVSLRRFNEKAKMWVTINFSEVTGCSEFDVNERVTQMLSVEFLNSFK